MSEAFPLGVHLILLILSGSHSPPLRFFSVLRNLWQTIYPSKGLCEAEPRGPFEVFFIYRLENDFDTFNLRAEIAVRIWIISTNRGLRLAICRIIFFPNVGLRKITICLLSCPQLNMQNMRISVNFVICYFIKSHEDNCTFKNWRTDYILSSIIFFRPHNQ